MNELIVTALADYTIIPLVGIAAFMLLVKVDAKRRYDIYTRIFMAGVSSYFVAKIAARIWQPTGLRPFEELGLSAGASYLNNPGFPSDHALFAAFLTLAVWHATRSKVATIVMAVLALMMCVGRVLALVHTPLDIVGGIAIAALGGAWYIAYAKKQDHHM